MKDKIKKEWLEKRNNCAMRLTYLLGSVRITQNNQYKENDLLSDDEIGKLALVLAENIYPNPLNKMFPIPKSKKVKK
jgi:hypothetical protein